MAQGTFFKTFTSADRTSTRTLLHEAIPITGSLISGSYNRNTDNREKNVKVFSHGMFQSVYDYPYLSSSANHILDLTVGCSSQSALSASTVTQIDKKRSIYDQMAQILCGYDSNGNIKRFDVDGDFDTAAGKIDDAIFINFSRLLSKDEIKKGSFNLKFGVGNCTASSEDMLSLRDAGAETNYYVNSPAGMYATLYAYNADASNPVLSGSTGANADGSMGSAATSRRPCGLIFYQAGIAVLTASLLQSRGSVLDEDQKEGSFLSSSVAWTGAGAVAGLKAGFGPRMYRNIAYQQSTGSHHYRWVFGGPFNTGSVINDICDGVRNRLINISFNNTTELNSTVYFCRANHNEYNYSSNMTYLDGSKIRVKSNDILKPPRSYITTVGLYSADNELLAVAKLSEPLRKDPTNEVTLRVRLDY